MVLLPFLGFLPLLLHLSQTLSLSIFATFNRLVLMFILNAMASVQLMLVKQHHENEDLPRSHSASLWPLARDAELFALIFRSENGDARILSARFSFMSIYCFIATFTQKSTHLFSGFPPTALASTRSS